jgi:hypothetical protein
VVTAISGARHNDRGWALASESPVARMVARSNLVEIAARTIAMGISPDSAVTLLTRRSPPRCAVSRSNHASHINSTLVTIAAGKAIWRCFHSAHAVTEKQPMSTTSNPVQVSVHVPTT